jgi:exonuclease III
VSDNLTEGISVKSVSDNLTEGTISLQEDSKTDQTTLEGMEVPTATPSSDEGSRMSKRREKTPRQPKVKIFFMVNDNFNLDSNSFTIYHQNICGLKGKTDELISSMSPNLPQILCHSEHHLKHTELDQINIEGFKLCTAYCRQAMKRGGVCIFIQKSLEYSKIDVTKYCKDQDIDICMLNLKTTSFSSHIMAVYRASTGNFNLFLNRLDDSIKSIYRVNLSRISCGDINIAYLTENDRKRQLDSVLQTYNLTAIVTFPIRSQGISSTTIDNIFIDNSEVSNYTVFPFFNGLSDHDAPIDKRYKFAITKSLCLYY